MLVGYPTRDEWFNTYDEPGTRKILRASLRHFDKFLCELKGINPKAVEQLKKEEQDFFEYVRNTDEMELFRILEKIKQLLLSELKQLSTRFYLGHIMTWFRINGIKIDPMTYKIKIRWNKDHKEIKFTPDKDLIREVIDNSRAIRYKLFYTMAVATGARQSEILSLRKMDIDLGNKIPSVHFLAENTKTKQERYSFLTPECADLLKKHYLSKDLAPEDRIFSFGPQSLQIHFLRIRTMLGHTEKYKTGTAKFTIHRMRAYTKRNLSKETSGDDFAHLILGHSGGLATYDGDTIEALREEYSQAVQSLTMSDIRKHTEISEKLTEQNALLIQEIELLKLQVKHGDNDEVP